MNISDFVAGLETQGIELWREDEQLRFRAPAGVMTAALKQQLSAHKPALLAWLEEEERAEQQITPDVAGRYQPFPLTEAQQAYFVGRHSAFTFGGVACRGFLEVAFDRQVEPQALEAALRAVIARHDMLRVVIEDEGYQRVLPQVPAYRLENHVCLHLSPAEANRQTAQLREHMLAAPSDYRRWPLFAACSVQLAQETRLLLTIELILVDAASLWLLIDEIERQLFPREAQATETELRFRDYVIARRAARQGRRYRHARQYWLNRLNALPDAPSLPLINASSSAPFVRRQRLLSHAQHEQLRQLAACHRLTPTMLILGAFAQVLAFYSEQRRFTLNLPIFLRDAVHQDSNRLIGDFTSVTLLAVDLRDEQRFVDTLVQMSQQLFTDLEHSACSGIEVLSELSRQRGEPVLMPVVFTSTLGQEPASEHVRHYRILQGLTQTPQVLIDCQATATTEGVLLAWDCREAFFPEDVIANAFSAFCELIDSLLTEGDACLQLTQPLKLPSAQRRLRRQTNETYQALSPALLHSGVVQYARQYPDATALEDGDGSLSFGQLIEQAQALAQTLRQAGHQPADPVAVICGKGRAQALAPLAILLCGGCYVPIDPQQPAIRREAIMRNAQVNWAFCDADITMPSGVMALTCAPSQAVRAFQPSLVAPEQPAYIIYTSGSTGEPKGVVVSHQAAWNTLADINRRFAIKASDSILAIANLGFDLSVYDLFGVLAAGGRLVYPLASRRSDPSHWADLMAHHRITLWNTVPAQLQMLCDALPGPLADLRLALVSGDWVPLDLLPCLQKHAPQAHLIALGGATEAAIWSVFYALEKTEPHWKSVPYGKPLANQRLYVIDEGLNDRPDWVSGEIAIAGDGLASAYLGDAQKTAQRFVTRADGERLYLTGDRGRYWPDGNIEFLGRMDHQVKIRGHRVEPGEIAAVMRQHPAVADGVALLTEGNGTASQLYGFAELAQGVQPPANAALEAARRSAIATEQQIDGAAFKLLMDGADRVAILAMIAQLRASGLFRTNDARHTLPEIYLATAVADVHQRLLRRWLDGLISAGALHRDDEGRYHHPAMADDEQVSRVWREVERLEQQAGYGSQTLHYIRVCSDRLGGLLRGETDVRDLLFPQGELSTAHAAYRDNLVSQSMNAIVVSAITALAKENPQPLRILEVGAGVAGTASDLVPALADYTPEYRFTDLSEFFLVEARKLFAPWPWMRYGIFDMNLPAEPQGMLPNSIDVLLCANVLHNARNAGEVLRRFSSLLAPGGVLVFIEPFRRHNYPLLVSMEFFPELTGFTDLRADSDQTFFTREQWLTLLDEAGATLTGCMPAADSALASAGQGVFIAQFKTDRCDLRETELRQFLQARLPGYMIPAHLQLLDRLPRSASGKIDRQALNVALPKPGETASASHTGEAPIDALEQEIAAVWADVLGVANIARDTDFYAAGGDSLLLSRMIARIRKTLDAAAKLEWETLLRHLLREPTVMALAELLRRADNAPVAAQQALSPLVELWGTAQDKAHCCVLLHAGTGNLQPYQHVLTALDKSRFSQGVGLALPGASTFLNLAAEEALSRLAGQYTDLLIDRAESYTLVGYCLGGLLAAEIARQLTERGKRVHQLVAISAWQPPRVDDEGLVEYVFARALGADLTQLGLPPEPAFSAAVNAILQKTAGHIPQGAFASLAPEHQQVGQALNVWMAKPLAQRLALLQSSGVEQGVYHQEQLDDSRFAESYRLFCHSMAAVGRHKPQPWFGHTVVIRNSESDPLLPGTPGDVAGYWQAICYGNLIIDDTPGDHFSCLSRDNASILAATLSRHLLSGGEQ
ncbi:MULTISPECIES: amino acid adenylation domain-containing protein [Enterobacterales]|uniref:amino acid adenylation domain-containing protein n=1 Tax=Enterobacterales TaxID=91347 RepID=UPI002ED8299F